MLEATKLEKSFTIDNRRIPVLKGIDVSIKDGEFVVIRGTSGSGKSTLLSILSGLDRPTKGQVTLDGFKLSDASESEAADVRARKIGFIFQSFQLLPMLTAVENVAFPAEIIGDKHAYSKASALLKKVGLDHRKDNMPHQLSGGEKQRVALCRAIINKPSVIFADEPTGNLDSKNTDNVLNLLLDLHREMKSTLILVTHNDNLASSADRTLMLKDGRFDA